jgi:HEAT repeat protein
MQTIQPVLLGLGLFLAEAGAGRPAGPDPARLRELLHDQQHPRRQSQAALLLVQSTQPEAEEAVRQGLRQAEDGDVFLALAEAVRLARDGRFARELLAALAVNRPGVRQAAAEALAVVADAALVRRLGAVAADSRADLATRQAALWALGRSGRQQAVPLLLKYLADDSQALAQMAADALAELSGQDYGPDRDRWAAWWERHRGLNNERWLEARLGYQSARAQRLEGDLGRARAQVLRLEQQLYGRLPDAERLAHLESLLDQDDPAVRTLAVGWALELLATADGARQEELARVLLQLSRDGAAEVQRAAVLALGRVSDPAACDELRLLLRRGRPCVRCAAARALAMQARVADEAGRARQRAAVAALQKALDDPALEVVVEAAEALGELGALEAGPVLTGLLRHPSAHVRQTAAQALERVADATVLDGLLKGLDDPGGTVRFGLVGALARAAGDGRGLTAEQRQRLVGRLIGLLQHDPDLGVRGRAATVLGECAPPAVLGTLWECVLASEEGRVQEKAWAALVEVVVRSGSVTLLEEWDRRLAGAGQGPRRMQLLGEVGDRWRKQPETRAAAGRAQEALVQAQLDLGKWSLAFPLVRELLARPGNEAEQEQRLRWLLAVGTQALKEGNRPEALRAIQEAQPFLTEGAKLAAEFERLQKEASRKE